METRKFEFDNGVSVNVLPIMENESTWFLSTDVCKALEISNVSRAMDSLDEDDKQLVKVKIGDQQARESWVISEGGLYCLVFSSDNPVAKIFKKWITSEVLPLIRKTGKYTTAQEQDRQAKMKLLTKNIDKVDNRIEDHRKEVRRLGGIKEKMQKELRQYINEDINQLSLDFIV